MATAGLNERRSDAANCVCLQWFEKGVRGGWYEGSERGSGMLQRQNSSSGGMVTRGPS